MSTELIKVTINALWLAGLF